MFISSPSSLTSSFYFSHINIFSTTRDIINSINSLFFNKSLNYLKYSSRMKYFLVIFLCIFCVLFCLLHRHIYTHIYSIDIMVCSYKNILCIVKTSVGSLCFVFNNVYCIIFGIQRRHWLLTNKQQKKKLKTSTLTG